MAYRYQENLIHETLAVLHAFRERWDRARAALIEAPVSGDSTKV